MSMCDIFSCVSMS
ncbi:Protein of unknown function [Gryllus bimaculatus]|nr:Protein of unknown function [Gryllus bimaculatus]